MTFERAYLEDLSLQMRKLKAQAEGALAQVADDEMSRTIDPESNSLAVIVRHIAGNLRSRFTDFLTSDGEKPERNRDGEFEPPPDLTRAELMKAWESGWGALLATVSAVQPSDLLRDVYIRGERHTVLQALDRSLTHLAGHVGQIVFLAKHLRGAGWKTLSLPRRSAAPPSASR